MHKLGQNDWQKGLGQSKETPECVISTFTNHNEGDPRERNNAREHSMKEAGVSEVDGSRPPSESLQQHKAMC